MSSLARVGIRASVVPEFPSTLIAIEIRYIFRAKPCPFLVRLPVGPFLKPSAASGPYPTLRGHRVSKYRTSNTNSHVLKAKLCPFFLQTPCRSHFKIIPCSSRYPSLRGPRAPRGPGLHQNHRGIGPFSRGKQTIRENNFLDDSALPI